MKTVGKQLQEARLARNWTPQLASRETKIKVERLCDLEADDYTHFASPTYARGFVRTYARALGLDEYRILRQLDQKLPDDDSANIVTDGGMAYLPETSMPARAAHRNYAGLYIVTALGAVVTLAIAFVLLEAYRVGELSNWFASSPETVAPAISGTNAAGAPASPLAEPDNRAKPVDSNTPPPIVDSASTTNTAGTTNVTNGTNAPAEVAPAEAGTTTPPKALPVDPSVLAAGTAAAPGTDEPMGAVKALPVDPSELTNAAPVTPVPAQQGTKTPPRALPVDPSELAAPPSDPSAAPGATTLVAANAPAPANGTNEAAVATPSPAAPPAAAVSDKRLVLTASQDSFVRVTNLDGPETDKALFAAVLHSGQSIGFDGRKFSISVGIPSAVDIKLDGVNYGPHSDQAAPETFTIQSHLP